MVLALQSVWFFTRKVTSGTFISTTARDPTAERIQNGLFVRHVVPCAHIQKFRQDLHLLLGMHHCGEL